MAGGSQWKNLKCCWKWNLLTLCKWERCWRQAEEFNQGKIQLTGTCAHSSLQSALRTALTVVFRAKGGPWDEAFISLWCSVSCPHSRYKAEAWWGELKLPQRRKREGRTWPAEFRASLRQEVFSKSSTCQIKMQNCAHRVTTRSDNMGKAVRLGWDLFSFTQDPWHNCPFEDFQRWAFKACQRHAG